MRRRQKQLVESTIPLNGFGFNNLHQGIYCLFCENDKTYVGQSRRIESRFSEHRNKKPIKCFVLEHINNPSSIIYSKVISPEKVIDTCEALWIAILQPELNIQKPKLHVDHHGCVLGYCTNPGENYEKPNQLLMRQVASALKWPLEKQNQWMGELWL